MSTAPHLVQTVSSPLRPGYGCPEGDGQAPAVQLPSRPRSAVATAHEEMTHIASRPGRDTAETGEADLAPPRLRLVAGGPTAQVTAPGDGPALEPEDIEDVSGVEDRADAGTTTRTSTPASADPEADFSALFRAMHTEVRTFALRRTDVELVDDVVGDTFLAVWHGWDKVPTDHSGRRAWVYGVLRNKILQATQNAGRRARLRAKVSSLRPSSHGPVDETIESLRAARDLLDLLPPGERDAVALTVLGGLTCAETAEVLECSVSSVTTRVSRARTRLRTILTERATTGGERA